MLIVTVVGAIVVNILSSAEYSLSLFGIYGILSLILTASIRASYVVLETLAASVESSRCTRY